MADRFEQIAPTTFRQEGTAEREITLGNSKSQVFEPMLELNPWKEDSLKIWKDISTSLSVGSNVSDHSALLWEDSKEQYTFSPLLVNLPDEFSGLTWPGVKFHILLNSIPKIDPDGYARFVFQMSGYEDMKFNYQGLLSQHEIGEGAIRPEYVIDSIAVRHKVKANNHYQTGKICHILRPWCRDSLGHFIWGKWEWSFQNGTITKCIPQAAFQHSGAAWWLVDATFGFTSEGASSYRTTASYWAVHVTTTTEAGEVQKIWGHFSADAGDGARTLELALMEDPPGEPVAGEASVGLGAGPLTSQNLSVDVSGNAYSIAAATDYWIGWHNDNTSNIYYDGGSADTLKQNFAWDATWNDPLSLDYDLSLYLEYTAAGGTGIPVLDWNRRQQMMRRRR